MILSKIKQLINEDIPIDNLIFDYKCSNCQAYPIICKIFYCDKCQYYLCEDCEKKGAFHEHNLLVIDSREELNKIKEKENDELDKNRKEIEKLMEQDNAQNNRNLNSYNNNFINYNHPSNNPYNNQYNNQYNNPYNNPYNNQYNYQSNYIFNHPNNFPYIHQSDRRNFSSSLIGRNRGGRIFYYINNHYQNQLLYK